MQQGSLTTKTRLEGPDIWQFRWSEKGPNGKRVYRKRVIGTIEEFPTRDLARSAVAGLIAEINWTNLRSTSTTMTVAQLCSHFEQRELALSNKWRSYSTKACYAVYLRRWIVSNWGKLELRDVRTIEFESRLRRLPLAKSSCAKIRGVMSVLFNHACRYEFFDRNPIHLVRQGAKRKSAPNVLTPEFTRLQPILVPMRANKEKVSRKLIEFRENRIEAIGVIELKILWVCLARDQSEALGSR